MGPWAPPVVGGCNHAAMTPMKNPIFSWRSIKVVGSRRRSLLLCLFLHFFFQLYDRMRSRKVTLCGPCGIIFRSPTKTESTVFAINVHFNFLASVSKTTGLKSRQGTPEGAKPQNYSLVLISVLMLPLKESVVTRNLPVKWQLIKSQLSTKNVQKNNNSDINTGLDWTQQLDWPFWVVAVWFWPFTLLYFIENLQEMGFGVTQGTVSGPFLVGCIESPIDADHSRLIVHIVEGSRALRLIFYILLCRWL